MSSSTAANESLPLSAVQSLSNDTPSTVSASASAEANPSSPPAQAHSSPGAPNITSPSLNVQLEPSTEHGLSEMPSNDPTSSSSDPMLTNQEVSGHHAIQRSHDLTQSCNVYDLAADVPKYTEDAPTRTQQQDPEAQQLVEEEENENGAGHVTITNQLSDSTLPIEVLPRNDESTTSADEDLNREPLDEKRAATSASAVDEPSTNDSIALPAPSKFSLESDPIFTGSTLSPLPATPPAEVTSNVSTTHENNIAASSLTPSTLDPSTQFIPLKRLAEPDENDRGDRNGVASASTSHMAIPSEEIKNQTLTPHPEGLDTGSQSNPVAVTNGSVSFDTPATASGPGGSWDAEDSFAMKAAKNASQWNALLRWARHQRGPQWDYATGQYHVDRGQPEYYAGVTRTYAPLSFGSSAIPAHVSSNPSNAASPALSGMLGPATPASAVDTIGNYESGRPRRARGGR